MRRRGFELITGLFFLFTIFCLMLVIFLEPASANQITKQWISLDSRMPEGSKPIVMCTGMDANGLNIEVHIPGYWREKIRIGSDVYDRITVSDLRTTMEIGSPELPLIHTLIAIPEGAKLSFESKVSSSIHIKNYFIYPFQPLLRENETPGRFMFNKTVYQQTEPFPKQVIGLSEPVWWRDLHIAEITIAPLQFIPATDELQVISEIKVRVNFVGNRAEKFWPDRVSSRLEKLYRQMIINYEYLHLPAENEKDNPGIDYLIIANPDLVGSTRLADLIAFHEGEGKTVSLATTNDTGTTSTSIKNYITAIYQSSNPPDLDYVLFVGDVDVIPIASWDSYPSDSWYSCLQGDDLFPEIGIGRIPAENISSLDHAIDKILAYANRDDQSAWTQRALLVAHKEGYPGKYTQCAESIRTADYILEPPIFDTVYGGEGGTNNDVIAAINEGRNIVNYRGHGSETTWDGWSSGGLSFNNNMASNLLNGDKTPVVFSVACLNGAIQESGTTLSEAFFFAQYGAVAFLGATQPSYTEPNHDFDRFLFKSIFNKGILPISDILMDANQELSMLWGVGTIADDNIKMYLWLGDPAMKVIAHSCEPPNADFAASYTKVLPDMEVQFKDRTCGDINSWQWNFGDGNASDWQNPVHSYAEMGFYTVSLTVSGDSGMDTETKTNYIEVADCMNPAVTSVDPASGYQGRVTNITIQGNWFEVGSTTVVFNLGNELMPCENVQVQSAMLLTCDVNGANHPLGKYDIVATTSCGQGILAKAFDLELYSPCGIVASDGTSDWAGLFTIMTIICALAFIRRKAAQQKLKH